MLRLKRRSRPIGGKMSDVKPKTYWVNPSQMFTSKVAYAEGSESGLGPERVIEHSAYDALVAEVERLKAMCNRYRAAAPHLSPACHRTVGDLMIERDKLRADNISYADKCELYATRIGELEQRLLDVCSKHGWDDNAKLRAALERIAKIRTLPLTDIHDTDAELASQYSSVIDTLVYIAREALGREEEK